MLVDKLTGHMLASMIGMALFHRERTGQGQEVHVPMLETTLSFLLVEHLWWATLGEPERGVGYPRMMTPHRRPYPTKDGFISVIASSDAQYARLLAALGRPELIDDPRFTSIAARAMNVDAVLAVLTEGLRARTTSEWLAILTEADIPCGNAEPPRRSVRGRLPARHRLLPVRAASDGRRVTLPAIAPAFSATPPSVRRLWPTLGEHTREVFQEAGFTDTEIAEISEASA